MRTDPKTLLALSVLAVGALALAAREGRASGARSEAQVASAVDPALDLAVLHAQPYRLAEPYVHTWCVEQPLVANGWLLVLEVPPALARQRAMPTPVLYVGDQVAERVNQGWPSGRLVVLVPGPLDLGSTPIWFGAPGLPETLDTTSVDAARSQAVGAGARPRPSSEVAEALKQGGPSLDLTDRDELIRTAAALVLLHAPSEHERVEGLLAPPPEQAVVRELPARRR